MDSSDVLQMHVASVPLMLLLQCCSPAGCVVLADYYKLMGSPEVLAVVTMHVLVRPPQAGKAAGETVLQSVVLRLPASARLSVQHQQHPVHMHAPSVCLCSPSLTNIPSRHKLVPLHVAYCENPEPTQACQNGAVQHAAAVDQPVEGRVIVKREQTAKPNRCTTVSRMSTSLMSPSNIIISCCCAC